MGGYQLAYQLCVAPALQASFLINRIAFPAMSRLQDDLVAMRRAFLKVLSHVTLVALPVSVGIIAVSSSMVRARSGRTSGSRSSRSSTSSRCTV